MLIAHASSTCDVCLEPYTEDCSYHSIPCGHVFCLPCLVSTNPAKCPLCRHEYSSYTMRKLHFSLPSPRDLAARKLEIKLVQSSPEMTLAESLALFQEVQDWLEGESQDEFLVLRAFSAVLCGFHETKDKLLQNQTLAEQNEAQLKRLLEEARNTPNPDVGDYKTKYRAAKAELAALQAECTELRAQVEQQHQQQQQQQQRNAEYQAHYAQIQAQAQLHVQAQAEPQQVARHISNPLPAPPRPIEIPFLKFIDSSSSSRGQFKGKSKESSAQLAAEVDPMTSAFVPTLSASIPSRHHDSHMEGRPEVTTLVFKPPKRIPIWNSPASTHLAIEDSVRFPPEASQSDASVPVSDTGASVGVNPALGPSTVDSIPQPVHQRPHLIPSSRPTSDVSAGDWDTHSKAYATHRAPTPETARKAPRHRHHRESFPIPAPALPPALYPARPEANTLLVSPILDPPPTPRFKPAWQGGTGIGANLRRASSPVVVGNSLPVGRSVPEVVVMPQRSEDEQPDDTNRRSAAIRVYALQNLEDNRLVQAHHRDHSRRHRRRTPSPPLEHPRQPEPQSEPESRTLTRSTTDRPQSSGSPVMSGKEASKAARYSLYESRHPLLGHSHSLSTTALLPSHPSGSRVHAESFARQPVHSGLAYPSETFPSENRAPPSRLGVYPGELSSSTWHINGATPRVVPVAEL